jgi:hypothetical protein
MNGWIELVTDTYYSCMDSGASREFSSNSACQRKVSSRKHRNVGVLSTECTCDDIATAINPKP